MKLQFGKIKKIISLSVLRDDKNDIYNGFEVRFRKSEIEILKHYKNIIGTKEIIKKIGKSRPILLHFEGKGILNRKVKSEPEYRRKVIINGNIDDFYFTDYVEETEIYTSVVRQSFLEDILFEFQENQIMVVGIASGPFILMAIHQYLNEDHLISARHIISVKKRHIVDFRTSDTDIDKTYRIGKEVISKNGILALSQAAVFFQPSSAIILPEKSKQIAFNTLESEQKVLFQQFGLGLMIFFLLALLGNYLYLQHLNKVHQTNVFQLAEHTETFDQINKLEEEKTRKETLLRKSGVLTKKFVSFYIATISNSVPKEITFTEFVVRPTKEEIKEKYKIEVDNQLLTIKGITKSSHYLSDWLMKIKTFDWIRKIEIEEYEYTEGYGEFYLKIII